MSATAAVLFCLEFVFCFFLQRKDDQNTVEALAKSTQQFPWRHKLHAEAHQWQVAMQIGSLDVELLSKCFEVMVPLQHLRYGLYVFTSLEFM